MPTTPLEFLYLVFFQCKCVWKLSFTVFNSAKSIKTVLNCYEPITVLHLRFVLSSYFLYGHNFLEPLRFPHPTFFMAWFLSHPCGFSHPAFFYERIWVVVKRSHPPPSYHTILRRIHFGRWEHVTMGKWWAHSQPPQPLQPQGTMVVIVCEMRKTEGDKQV